MLIALKYLESVASSQLAITSFAALISIICEVGLAPFSKLFLNLLFLWRLSRHLHVQADPRRGRKTKCFSGLLQVQFIHIKYVSQLMGRVRLQIRPISVLSWAVQVVVSLHQFAKLLLDVSQLRLRELIFVRFNLFEENELELLNIFYLPLPLWGTWGSRSHAQARRAVLCPCHQPLWLSCPLYGYSLLDHREGRTK